MFMPKRFKNRTQAGELLAQGLRDYAGRSDVIVLALPRGGMRVGFSLAKNLNVALDVVLVRKLNLPGQEGDAVGVVASGGLRLAHHDATAGSKVPNRVIERVVQKELQEIARREELYRRGRSPPRLLERVVILVDEGLAAGSAMFAAVEVVRRERPARIIVAVPVGAAAACKKIRSAVDELICLHTPDPLYAVGMWYKSFTHVSDEEVRRLLDQAEQQHSQQSLFSSP